MHLNDEQIQRFLHGELDAPARDHVAGCDHCAAKIAEAEREERAIFELFGQLDHPTPRVDARSITGERSVVNIWGRRAAGMVVVAALAGAAYAIPGSPLPAVIQKVAQWITGGDDTPTPREETPPAPPVASGIAVPAHPRFAIEFVAEQEGGVAALSLVDGPNVAVRAYGGTVTFTTEVDRLIIDNRASEATYQIDVPRGVTFLEIAVGARRLVVKDGESFAADIPSDERGRRLLSLSAEKE